MSFVGELNWDLVRNLGYDDLYYHIDCWLSAEGIDSFACALLPERWGCPTFSRITMWRTFLLMSFNEWTQTETARRVGDSLSMRIFVRRQSLEEVTPSQQHLSIYQKRFADLVNQGLHFTAGLWSQSGYHDTDGAPRPRKYDMEPGHRSRQLLDAWSVRIKSGPLPLPRSSSVDH